MKVEIKNYNNIEEGNIEIKENSLNIKYAINGTGKTTIAKAIRNKILNEDLNTLKPFKYQNNKEIVPKVEGIDSIKSVKLFNEEYVNQYVFLKDEVVKSSFEIFIKNEEYEKEMKYINELLADIKDAFVEDNNLNELISNLKEMSDSFGKSKSGYAANSVLSRGLGNGNKIENIPEELKEYSDYLRSDVNSKWLKWQLSGKEYLKISNVCPYCTSNTIEENKSKINALSDQYDAKVIEHLNKILEVFSKLNAYFSDEVKNKISIITKNIDGISSEQENFLIEVKSQIEVLIEKLEKLKNIGFITLKDSDKIMEIIKNYKIDMEYLQHLNSKETIAKVIFLNQKIEVVLNKAGELQGNINKQKENISKLDNTINKLIYIRRYYEIKNKSSLVYHLVSSLFQKREIPTIESEKRELTEKEIGLLMIRK